MPMHFTKMHGAGNDYVYVDCFRQTPPDDPSGLSRRISDRHCGVGSDGLILICPSSVADARMRMFNADGSEAQMCGNGIRCVAKFVYDRGLVRHNPLRIETGRGILTLELDIQGGAVHKVRVDMGEPILEAEKIPTRLRPSQDASLAIDHSAIDVTCVSMGNPHCVIFCEELSDSVVRGLGPKIEMHGAFPERTNVEFVRINRPDDITARVWERGSGETMACGTGACAMTVAGALTGRTGRSVRAHLRGGDLEIVWSETDNHVYLTGPAVEVFEGEWLAD
jgi:diaminopimelate epimerase